MYSRVFCSDILITFNTPRTGDMGLS